MFADYCEESRTCCNWINERSLAQMDAPGAPQRTGGNANDNQNHPQVQKNLSGLKHALHGTSYQLQLGIVVTLANAKKSKCPANNFTFKVTAEGRDESNTQNRNEKCTPDKFDDIIYDFKHGSITGTLKIQAKHKQESSNLKITLNDLIAVSKNDFCIDQYFKSFRDQPQAKTKNDVEGFIICTNADLDDDAKVLWKPVDAAVLGDSTTSLDPYISSLFNETRGNCYQLKTHYKHAAFARLLINAIKSKEQLISWKTPLFKEYRQFIMNIIVKKDNPAQNCVWKFKDSFLYSSNSISNPGYRTFRNEFKGQYRKEFKTGDSVWKHLEDNNKIHVSEDCLFDQNREKSTMLAWLLIKAIASKKEKVSWQKPLFKEYRAAILDVIDKNNYTTEDDNLLCKFNDKFVDGTFNDSILNYNTFRKDFEDQYRKAFNFDGTVWEDLKNRNQIYVAENFLNDKKKQNITSSTKTVEFPKNITESADDKVDESLNEIFCDRFRLVCGTYNQDELEIAIAKNWKMLHAGDGHMTTACLETKLASDWLFKTNFDWMMSPFENSLHSEDIIKDFENIHGTLAYMKLEPISDKLRKKVLGSPFRISDKTLGESELYKQIKTENLLQVEAFDIQFGATLLSDILDSQGHTTILFLEYSDFIHNLDTIEAVLRGKTHYCLVIICREYEAFKKVQGIVRKWKTYLNHKEDISKNPEKHVFLIRKASDIPSDLSCFRLSGLKSESWDQFCKESISLCGTVISPCKIFQSSFTDLQIEEIIKLLDWGKQMNKNNQILKNFEKIKDIYVHRRMTLCSYGKKNGEYHSTRTDTPKVTDIQKAKSNLSRLTLALHATAYRLKLGIVVYLANAKKSLDPANDFSFEVAAEDPSAGKFDDIVYTFKDGGKAGILKIQVKYKLGSPAPKITVKDFTTNSDTKNPFAILKYFTSFCDQQQSTTDLEGFVICTNADINDQAKNIWKIVEPAITNDSAPSLDSYVSSLFDSIGAQYYQLKYYKLWAADGTYSNLYQLLRKCSKRARLAKLLIEAIKSNKKITSEIALFKEYRQAILQVIDRNENSRYYSYGFTKEFLDSSYYNSMPGYEAFRQEFEDQYREEFKIDGCVWDDLRMKQLLLSKDFVLDEKNQYSSSATFPDDNVDESFKSFCDRFRLVCGTYNEQGLDAVIVESWRNLHFNDNQLVSNQLQYVGEKVITGKLFKMSYDWLMDPYAKPLYSENFIKTSENIEGTLAYMKLEPISDNLRKEVVESPFGIRYDIIKASDLYRQVETESFLQVEAFDIQFGVKLLSDVLGLQNKDHTTTLFLNESDFIHNSDTVEAVLRGMTHYCLVIICLEAFETVQSLVQKWKKDILKGTNIKIFLIRKTHDIPSDLKNFRICDLTEESWEQFCNKSISLCGRAISPLKIFQNSFRDLSIEEIIQRIHSDHLMIKNVDIEHKRGSEDVYTLKSINDALPEEITFEKITTRLKKDTNFNEMLEEVNISKKNQETIYGYEGKKVVILLGEAGHGKSTNLTWLAWHLRQRNPSFWVVRCNLSDHCTDFKPFTPKGQKNSAGQANEIDETKAIRLLYKLAYSSLQLERKMDEVCSLSANCLVLLDGKANVSKDLTKQHGFSNSIVLQIFKEKLNAGEMVLLFDGFDEIAPNYKEVVLELLSLFETFEGVKKIYLTSRPYGFKKQFETAFMDPLFFQFKPFLVQDKASMVYKMMKEKWRNRNIGDDTTKSLCYMLLCSLGDMSDVPLNLMMAVDVLEDSVYHNENINNGISSEGKLFETILNLSKPSFIVEEFVKVKILHRLYDKKGLDKNNVDKPGEGKRFEKEINDTKLLHGLLALWIFFDENELATILSADETLQAENYKKLILDGDEKTGIIHGIQNDAPVFIHRSFAEYLAAWWLIQRQKEGKQQDRIKITSLESFWDRERKELRKYIDIILTQNHPLPHAIIECDWQAVESLLSTSQNSTIKNPLFVRDDGERTPLHLLAIHFDFERKWLNLFEDSIISDIINCEEKIFGWTALDYAFQMDKPRLIFYLLHHGASINVDVLYEHIALARNDKIRKAAKYARYVMQYLSQQAIEYKSHDACRKMKQFCDKVVADLVNKSSATQRQILEYNIREDTVWMLESVIHAADRMHFVRGMISYFDLALHRNSCFMLKYFMAHDPSVVKGDNLMKCAVYAALKDYKIEFKYFVDFYCSRSKIRHFQSLSIQSDAECYLIDYFNDGEMDTVCEFTNNICWEKQGIPTELMIDENILSLLTVCVVTVRPSMLRYLKESCKLNLCAGLVFSLAMFANHLFSKLPRETTIKPSKAYECLLDQASNISDVEANTMLRLAITSNLFEFSKCLIERFRGIDFQAVNELNGWNVFHLCASNQRSFWAEQIIEVDDDDDDDDDDGSRASCVDDKIDLFRYMLAKASDMDCFNIFDQNGKSILHLAMENGQRGIVEYIVARKLGQYEFNEIRSLSVIAIPNITLCYHAIHEISKSVEEKWWHQEVLCMLAKQIAMISLTNSEESQELNSGRLLFQENAKELYQMAMKCRSLYLMYYLHREFPDAIPPLIYGADWLTCTARCLRSPNFLDVTKWMLNPSDVDQHPNLYEVVDKCDDEGYDLGSVSLEKLVKQVETILSANRSMEEVCKLKLLAVAVCLKNESMIRHLFETLNVNIDWKVLIDIMDIAHRSHIHEPGTTESDGCPFEKLDFNPIYRYLFERISKHDEIDAEGKNVIHFATQSGLGCMAKFLIKNMAKVTTIDEQNGWNIFHYYASRKSSWKHRLTKHDHLLSCITKAMLEITSDDFRFSSLTESHKNKIKELCFNSNEGRKSVIHIAVEAGDIWTAEYIIQCRLGITYIDKQEITNSCEYLRVRECYDEVYQIAAQLPFNGYCDYLLHRLVKIIQRCSREPIEHIKDQGNVEDHIVEDACRSAIIYRSVSTLEHLMTAYEDQMNQPFARSTNYELVACMTECIRRNRISMFNVLVGHYRTLQDIQSSIEVEFENEENDNIDETTIDEEKIQWRIIDEFAQDVTMNRDFLHLLILSVAYGRLSMTQFLVEMLQPKVSKSLLQLIMKVLKDLWDENCKTATPVYEYLASRCEGNANLLHLCIQAECYSMLEYLIKEKNLDPNEVDSENGWNAGHYFVSGPISSGYKVFTWMVEEYNMDCFGVYDRNDRSILHLAIENGYNAVVKYIINHRLCLKEANQPWYAWDLKTIEKHINELQKILESLPENIPQQTQQVLEDILERVADRNIALTTYKQLYANQL